MKCKKLKAGHNYKMQSRQAHSTNIVTIQTLSVALQSVNPLLHTLFIWLLVFLIQVILLQVVLIQIDSVKV